MSESRDRDAAGRARSARARDDLGRPLDQPGLAATAEEEVALPPDAALARAQELLVAGKPFAAHEVLEAVWKASDTDRELWRGLAQLAVGITHALRGNQTGATALLVRAGETLAPYEASSPHDVDVIGLRRWAADAAADLTLATKPPNLRR